MIGKALLPTASLLFLDLHDLIARSMSDVVDHDDLGRSLSSFAVAGIGSSLRGKDVDAVDAKTTTIQNRIDRATEKARLAKREEEKKGRQSMNDP